MSDTFIDYELLRAFDLAGFQKRAPFPWHNLRGFLTAEGFRALFERVPAARTVRVPRKHGSAA